MTELRLKKLKVAITGNIGSGKTTFSRFLSEKGYPVIFADEVSKELLANDPVVRKKIIHEFGEESYQGKRINTSFLAGKIFSNPKKLKKINSILHPEVRKKIELLSLAYFKTKDIVFVEAALIYESKIENMYDFVVLIAADIELRMKRSLAESKVSEKDFYNRNRSQIDDSAKVKKADFIFINNGSKNNLKEKAELLSVILESYLK